MLYSCTHVATVGVKGLKLFVGLIKNMGMLLNKCIAPIGREDDSRSWQLIDATVTNSVTYNQRSLQRRPLPKLGVDAGDTQTDRRRRHRQLKLFSLCVTTA